MNDESPERDWFEKADQDKKSEEKETANMKHLLNDEDNIAFYSAGILRRQNKCRAAYPRANTDRCKKGDGREKPGQ